MDIPKRDVCFRNIPRDMIYEIINHISLKDVYHFRCTCKYIHQVIDHLPKGYKKKLVVDRLQHQSKEILENLNEECVIFGSFILQAMLGEKWSYSDIDILTEDKLILLDKNYEDSRYSEHYDESIKHPNRFQNQSDYLWFLKYNKPKYEQYECQYDDIFPGRTYSIERTNPLESIDQILLDGIDIQEALNIIDFELLKITFDGMNVVFQGDWSDLLNKKGKWCTDYKKERNNVEKIEDARGHNYFMCRYGENDSMIINRGEVHTKECHKKSQKYFEKKIYKRKQKYIDRGFIIL